jgi:hypothetical protein
MHESCKARFRFKNPLQKIYRQSPALKPGFTINNHLQDYVFSSQNPINSLYAPFTFLS